MEDKKSFSLVYGAVFVLVLILGWSAVARIIRSRDKAPEEVVAESSAAVRDANYARAPRFRALLYYSLHVEDAHRDFALQGLDFYRDLTVGEGFLIDTCTVLGRFSAEQLAGYDVIVALNCSPASESERALFEHYMENGGGWVGYHAAAYNDRNTGWPWLNRFLGCGTFLCNNWPPQPVLLEVDSPEHPVCRNLPASFVAPASEYYQWSTDVRHTEGIEVLLSLSGKNYPLGLKDIVYGGDWPVVWTNTAYRMIYLNMGHGNTGYTDATQNLLYINALRWVVSRSANNPFED